MRKTPIEEIIAENAYWRSHGLRADRVPIVQGYPDNSRSQLERAVLAKVREWYFTKGSAVEEAGVELYAAYKELDKFLMEEK